MTKQDVVHGTGGQPIALVVLDQHPLTRAGVSNLLAAERDIKVVGEAATLEQAIRQCRRHRPDVVLMDLDLPPAELIASMRRLHYECRARAVVVLSHADSDAELYRAAVAGAAGHVADVVGASELAGTIRRAAHGHEPIGDQIANRPSVGRRVLETFRELATQSSTRPAGIPTARQLEILELAARGLTNQQIGRQLALSASSVKGDFSALLKALGLRHRTQAVVHAIREGWISPPDSGPLSFSGPLS